MRWTRHHRILFGLLLALLCATLAGLGLGAVTISPAQLLGVLGERLGLWPESGELVTQRVIFWTLRAPRVALGCVIGASLALAGASLQGIFRNPLADPGLIGVSSGASLAVVGLIVLGSAPLAMLATHLPLWLNPLTLATPVAAFGGGLLVTGLVLRLSRVGGRVDMATMLLAGIAINALVGALIGLAIAVIDEEQLRTLTLWTLGSLSGASWSNLALITAGIVPVGLWLLRAATQLNLLLLGEREAAHLGVDVARLQRAVVGVSALMVGIGVGFVGMIGFVGLVVPHLVRMMGGADHRYVLPASALLGALLLTLADLCARLVTAPAELPIGVVTALMGAPFFLGLLLQQRARMMGGVA